MASNFLIALEATAEELLAAAGIEDGRDLLAPLVLRSAANWAQHGSTALTGPIARGDEDTVRRHLEAIEEIAPELADSYRAMAARSASDRSDRGAAMRIIHDLGRSSATSWRGAARGPDDRPGADDGLPARWTHLAAGGSPSRL